MLIVDSQVHIWAANSPERPWPARHKPHRPEPFSSSDLLREMDAAGVHAAVIVPPSWEGERNDLGLEAARLHPHRFAVVGRMDTDAPSSLSALKNWLNQPGMLGLRLAFNTPHMLSMLTEGRLGWLWTAAEEADVPIMVRVLHPLVHHIDAVAGRHPKLRLIMDHMAMPMEMKDDAAFAEIDKLLTLSKRPNVAVKASGLPYYSTHPYPYKNILPYFRRVYDAFGPQRMFWGTDLTKLSCSYRQAVTLFTEDIPWLAEEDKDWIMGRALCTWLDWKLPQAKSG